MLQARVFSDGMKIYAQAGEYALASEVWCMAGHGAQMAQRNSFQNLRIFAVSFALSTGYQAGWLASCEDWLTKSQRAEHA